MNFGYDTRRRGIFEAVASLLAFEDLVRCSISVAWQPFELACFFSAGSSHQRLLLKTVLIPLDRILSIFSVL